MIENISNLALFQAGSSATGGIGFLLPIILMFAIFYFLLIRPQQVRQKKWQAMLGELKPGDRVVTSGGLKGAIMSVKDDSLILRVPPDNLKLEVSRASIVTVTKPDEPEKEK
jgi:preprotein translocase subunit YajC